MTSAQIHFPDCPYKGLMPYSEDDARFFFGRAAEKEIIIANLYASRLTLLYGPSGVGKSSVLRAGVSHDLREVSRQNLERRGTPEFAVVVFDSWRDDPVAGLVSRVEESVAWALNFKEPEQIQSSGSLVEILEAWTNRLGGDLLIVLDQFEEYFLYHPQERGEGTFAFEFPRAVNRRDLRVSFLISIRDDSLAKLDRFKGRIGNLFDNYLRIDHLALEAGREAVERPVEQYNSLRGQKERALNVEPELVEAILEQVRTGRVALTDAGKGVVTADTDLNAHEVQIETPYLQLVLTRLWQAERQSGSLTLRRVTLEDLGGARSIVRTHVDNVMDELPQRDQDAAASVFYHLVTPGGAKIAHTVTDLAKFAGLEEDQLKPLLDRLSGTDARILRPVAPPPDKPTTSRHEVFHDVLALAILDWRGRYVQAREQAEAKEKAAIEAAERLRKRIVKVLQAGLLLVSVLAAVVAWQWRRAKQAYGLAHIRQLAAQSNDTTLRLPNRASLAVEAMRIFPSPEGDSALRRIMALLPRHVARLQHGSGVANIAFTPDGKYLATASWNSTAHLWETATGNELKPMKLNRAILGVAFSPDGKHLATASKDETVRIWDSNNSEQLRLMDHDDNVRVVIFSHDGEHLVSAGDDETARVWAASTGELRAHMDHKAPIWAAALSPDGRYVATGSRGGGVGLWDWASGNQPLFLSHTGNVDSVAFSPDGKHLATAGTDDHARLWDVNTGEQLAGIKHNGPVVSVAFSENGEYLATASGQTVRIWDAVDSQRELARMEHEGKVMFVVFSPDGKYVATASEDETARLWKVPGGKEVAQMSHNDSVLSVAFSPDGKYVVTASVDTTARVWEPVTGQYKAIMHHEDEVYSVAFGRKGTRLGSVSRDGIIRVWEPTTGTELGRKDLGCPARDIAYSPDGKLLVTGDNKGLVRLWGADALKDIRSMKHDKRVWAVTFSHDGRYIASASDDDTACVWETGTGVALARLLHKKTDDRTRYLASEESRNCVLSVAFSPDGKLLATGDMRGIVRVWDWVNRKKIHQMDHWEPARILSLHVRSITFSPDGKYLATASEDRTARIWEIASEKEVARMNHRSSVWSVAFSPDGKHLATASNDKTTRIWDRSSRKEVIRMEHDLRVQSVAFSPDGRYLATACADRIVRVHYVRPSDLIAETQARLPQDLSHAQLLE